MKKKILAIFLSLCMAMSLLPVTALATEDGTAVTADTTELSSGSYYVSNGITLDHSLTIPEGKTVILDLRGQTLTLQQLLVNGSLTIYDSQNNGQIKSTITDPNMGAIVVGTAGLLTLQSGTINSPGYGVYVSDGGKTIVNGGMITSTYAPLAGNNTAGDMNFEVNDGTLTASNGPAIYMPGQVSLKITGGTLNGGISLRMGQVDISGGTINAITDNIDSITEFYDFSGNAWLADALYVFNGTYTSGNTTYGNSLNLNITGGTFNCKNDQGSAVAIYDLGKVDQNSQVNISGDAVLNSRADDRGAYQVLSLADVGVDEPAAGYGKKEYVGKVSTTITGGTFSSTVEQYLAAGYQCTENAEKDGWTVTAKNGMEADVSVPGTGTDLTATATVGGNYTGKETSTGSGEESGNVTAGSTVNISVTSGDEGAVNDKVSTSNITIDSSALNSVQKNDSVSNVEIATDVGTITLDKQAWNTITTNATTGDTTAQVTLSIKDVTGEDAAENTATYEITATANGKAVFDEESATAGTVTITVPAPKDVTGTVYVYYLGENGAELVDMPEVKEGNVSWDVEHFSTYYVTAKEQEASVTVTEDGATTTTPYETLADALNAVKDSGGTITLLKDATLENANYTINKSVTITGTGTITATNPNIHAFTISDQSSLTLNGVKLKITGKENYGIDVRYGATLTLNNAEIDVSGVSNATISASWGSASAEPGKFILNNSKITATDIGGNFSNGGTWTIGTGSKVTIDGCTTHGFSASAIIVKDGATVDIRNTGYRGISINDANGKLEIQDGGVVNVTNAGTDDSDAYDAVYLSKNATAGLQIAEGATLNVTKGEEGNDRIMLTDEAAKTSKMEGTVIGSLELPDNSSYCAVVYVSNGEQVGQAVVSKDSTITLMKALPNQGYNHFQGWKSSVDGKTYDADTQVPITANTIFTAVWSYIPPANPNYRIDIPDFEGGTVTANPTAAKAGATVTLTATPDEGYALSSLTVTDRFGDAVKVTENADGTYTFTMPNGQVTVKATFVETEEPAPAEPFPDVDENDWFYDEVVYVYENGLMNGVENNQFAPNTATNRAMLATILYRLAGEPAVSGDLPFTDVAAGTWYTDAVLWAAQNGIVNGLGENTFAPMNTLTREQLVTMLYRYAEAEGYDVSAAADLSGYPDADKVQTYAQEAMSWAVAEGIVEGMDGNLNPAGHATRAQIATILMRFCEGVAK